MGQHKRNQSSVLPGNRTGQRDGKWVKSPVKLRLEVRIAPPSERYKIIQYTFGLD